MGALSVILAHSADAYLLAAMPQSSSTAAMESLGQMACSPMKALSPPTSDTACSRCKHQRPSEPNQWQTHFQSPSDCRTDPVWRQLERQHSHVCQLPDMLLQRYASDNATIYKDHVLPTPRSIAALRAARWPVLVMLREPAGSLHGWCEKKRHEQRQVVLHGMHTACTHAACTRCARCLACTRYAHGMRTACTHAAHAHGMCVCTASRRSTCARRTSDSKGLRPLMRAGARRRHATRAALSSSRMRRCRELGAAPR